jgi:tetratricopeptide (TPR) repeat protein
MNSPGKSSVPRYPALIVCGLIIASSTVCLQSNAQLLLGSNGGDSSYQIETGTIYSPPLPSPKFLNKSQEVLFDNGKLKLAELVYFADKVDPDKPELSATQLDLKPWSENEKKDVTAILDRLLLIAPGLLISAASGNKLALCRARSLESKNPPFGSHYLGGAAATTCPCAIVLADGFFKSPLQFHGLVHELVHESELGGKISNSEEWVKFMNPIIAKARLKMQMTGGSIRRTLQAGLVTTYNCPSSYSCLNLTEALAEFTAAYVAGSDFNFDPAFINQFANRLLLPKEHNFPLELQFKTGLVAYKNKQYTKACQLLISLIGSEPKFAVTHAYLASCYVRIDDCKQSITRATEAVDCFDSAGVPWGEQDMLFALRLLTTGYGRLHEEDKAKALLDKMLAKIPFDRLALYQRFYIEARRKNCVDAVSDLYWCCFGQRYGDRLRDVDADMDYAQQCLESEVSKFPKLVPIILRRAHFFEWLGDREIDKPKKMSLYKRAASDYQKATELDYSNDPEVLFDCCNINLKLRDDLEAEKYEIRAIAEKPSSLESDLMHIQILDAKGKNSEAVKGLSLLWTKHEKELRASLPTIVVPPRANQPTADHKQNQLGGH